MKPLTICYLGNGRVPWCTEVHVTKSLETLGHEVIFLQEGDVTPEQVLAIVKSINADLFFWTHTWGWSGMDMPTLPQLPCPSVYFHLDLVRGIPDRETKVDYDPQYRCTYCFMPDGDPETISWFKSHDVNYFYSPPAVFHEGCYPAEPDPTQGNEVIFVGARGEGYHKQWAYRGELIRQLETRYGSRFTVYEHSSQKREHALNILYASSKVAVGDTFCPDFSRSHYVSDRLPETCGRGCPTVFPYIKGIEDMYEIGEEILVYNYGDWDGLFSQVDWLLSHDKQREQMRVAAMQRTLREHTYAKRLEKVLDTIAKQERW